MQDKAGMKRTKGTGVKLAYETLHDEILTLNLGPGEPLDETMLAERFGMSRSPVREALIRLAGDGLVVTLSNRTTVVAPIEVQGFPAYVEALDIAQRMNTRLAAVARSAADIDLLRQRQAEFVAAVRSGDHLRMSGSNMDFHMAVAAAGRNPHLAGFYERLLKQGRRILHLHFDYLEADRTGRLLTDDHDEMIEAIRRRDAERADALAHAHARQFRDSFLEYLKRGNLGDARL
jgi:DNA-binding GntR family transcriptional regulator